MRVIRLSPATNFHQHKIFVKKKLLLATFNFLQEDNKFVNETKILLVVVL